MKIFTWLARFFYRYFLYVKTDIYSILFGKKILNEFLHQANQDAVFKTLLKEADSRQLRLILLPVILEVQNTGMALFGRESPPKIAISIELMKRFLKKGGNSLNFNHLSFAHELGHFDQIDLENDLTVERKETCRIKKDCLYVELLASKRGIQIIRNIGGEVSKKLKGEIVTTSLVQCHRYGCLDFLKKDASQCPKIKETKEIVGLIFKENKISFLLSEKF